MDGTSGTTTGVPLPVTTVSPRAGAATGVRRSIATAASGHAPDGESRAFDEAKNRRCAMIISCFSDSLNGIKPPAVSDRNRTCFG